MVIQRLQHAAGAGVQLGQVGVQLASVHQAAVGLDPVDAGLGMEKPFARGDEAADAEPTVDPSTTFGASTSMLSKPPPSIRA